MADEMRLIVCTFHAAPREAEVLRVLRELHDRHSSIQSGNIAVVQKTGAGIVYRETRDPRNTLSEIAGVVAGSLAWIAYAFAGSLGQMAGPWAGDVASNAVATAVKEGGFPDEALYAIGKQLDSGSTALVMLVTPAEEADVVADLQHLGGTIIQHPLPPEVIEQITSSAGPDGAPGAA